MDLRVMSPSGFQDDRRSSVAFLTTLPRCGASEEACIFRSSQKRRARGAVTLGERAQRQKRLVRRLDRTA
jgi:hypothetical protein